MLLDLKRGCSLPESLAGYEAALRDCGVEVLRLSPPELPQADLYCVPAAAELHADFMRGLRVRVEAGSSLLLESGLAFTKPAAVAGQRSLLLEAFGVSFHAPVTLDLSCRVPYVDLFWPRPAKIRDFSRLVPISAPDAQVIGQHRQWPIALKRELGKGTLIMLGSPLGPALWTGDREAKSWLRALTRS